MDMENLNLSYLNCFLLHYSIVPYLVESLSNDREDIIPVAQTFYL